MKIVKHILFIFFSSFFIGSMILIISINFSGNPNGGMQALVYGSGAGLITLITLLFSFKKYKKTFLIELIVVPILFFFLEYGVSFIRKIGYQIFIGDNVENTIINSNKIFDKAWSSIDDPIKVKELLNQIENSHRFLNKNHIEDEKGAISLALLLQQKEKDILLKYNSTLGGNKTCRIINILLQNYSATPDEFLKLLKIQENSGKVWNLRDCIPDSLQEEYSFNSLVETGQDEIALALLYDNIGIKRSYDYLYTCVAYTYISEPEVKRRVISKILENTKLYSSSSRYPFFADFVEIVVLLQEEPYAKEYLLILQSKLFNNILENSDNWKYDDEDQNLQENFMVMYNFLGSENQLIKTIPKEVIASHLKKNRENQKEKR